MISSEACFAIWAAEGTVWSPWAKPVLFASTPEFSTDSPLTLPALDALPLPEAWTPAVLVVDVPGRRAVELGLGLAKRGHRPVPLFDGTNGPSPVIKMDDLVAALGAGSQVLKQMVLAPDAKPAFLLDSNRMATAGNVPSGAYDNRWVVLPQDFPSSTFIQSHGVRDVFVLLDRTLTPSSDLAHVLRRWQEGGLRLHAIDVESGRRDDSLQVPKPSLFRHAWYVALAIFGLRRSNVGGFGSVVPEETSRGGSGFYG